MYNMLYVLLYLTYKLIMNHDIIIILSTGPLSTNYMTIYRFVTFKNTESLCQDKQLAEHVTKVHSSFEKKANQRVADGFWRFELVILRDVPICLKA